MIRISRRLVVAALALAPAGCSGLLGGGGPPTALYTLTALRDFPSAGPPLKVEILIDKPNASDALDTVRIALRRDRHSFDYYANAAWTDPAPRMIQGLLVDSLQRSGRVAAASRDTLALRGDYELRIELRHFDAEYVGDATLPTVRIEWGLLLVRVGDRTVVGTRSVAASAQPAKNDVPSIVAAYDEALHAAMRDTLTWMLSVAGQR